MKHDFTWKDEYSLGIKEIDDQHKELVKSIHKLFTSINEQNTQETLGNILNDLVHYAGLHFSTEEKYFKKFEYELADEHIAEHRIFTKNVTDFQNQHKNNEIEISFKLIDFLEDWLLDHLITADQKYVKCFQEHGLS